MPAGRRRAVKVGSSARPGLLRRVLLLVLGTLAASAAWVFLVRAAIAFGESARDGRGASGWAMTVGAGAGATLCMLLVFVLVARVRQTLLPKQAPGEHRRG